MFLCGGVGMFCACFVVPDGIRFRNDCGVWALSAVAGWMI